MAGNKEPKNDGGQVKARSQRAERKPKSKHGTRPRRKSFKRSAVDKIEGVAIGKSPRVTKKRHYRRTKTDPIISKAEQKRKALKLKSSIAEKRANSGVPNHSLRKFPLELRLMLWDKIFGVATAGGHQATAQRNMIAALRHDAEYYWEALPCFYSAQPMTLSTRTFAQFYDELSPSAMNLIQRLIVKFDFINSHPMSDKYRQFICAFRHPQLVKLQNIQFLRVDYRKESSISVLPFMNSFLKKHDNLLFFGIRLYRDFASPESALWTQVSPVLLDLDPDGACSETRSLESLLRIPRQNVVTQEEHDKMINAGKGWVEYVWISQEEGLDWELYLIPVNWREVSGIRMSDKNLADWSHFSVGSGSAIGPMVFSTHEGI